MRRTLAIIAVSIALFVIDECEPDSTGTRLRCDVTEGEITLQPDGTPRVETTRHC